MANLWLTGAGEPTLGTGEQGDYYRDTETNLVYFRENPTTWVEVPAFTPSPDGVGTTWLYGTGAPLNGLGSNGNYYFDNDVNTVYFKVLGAWEAKGSLDFIGVYGVQWGNGTGAPANIQPLNDLPAGSFYLDVATSDIYYKNPSLVWEAKGQLGGGGGGGVTVENVLNSNSAVNALSAAQGKALHDALADKLDSSAYVQHYRGKYASVLALETAIATGADGDYAIVDTGTGNDAVYYIWDAQEGWVSGGTTTASTTDTVTEGSTNLYFTNERVRNTVLTDLSLATNAAISAADSVLGALGKLQKQITDILTNQRYVFVTDSNTTYTVLASAVTANGNTIIELSNNSLTSITVNTSTATGKTAGDSVTIQITGTYAAQILVADGVTLNGTLAFSDNAKIKTLIYRGSNVWSVLGG